MKLWSLILHWSIKASSIFRLLKPPFLVFTHQGSNWCVTLNRRRLAQSITRIVKFVYSPLDHILWQECQNIIVALKTKPIMRLQLKKKRGKFSPLLGFDLRSLGTESQCATNKLCWPHTIVYATLCCLKSPKIKYLHIFSWSYWLNKTW